MTRMLRWAFACLVVLLSVVGAHAEEPRPKTRTRNVIVVTADGLRWEDVFRGAEETLLNKEDGGVKDVEALRREFWRDGGPEQRREALMPFFWSTIAKQGQLYGNVDRGSKAKVTNGRNFSYPGYNEIFTGAADDRIDSNDKVPNPNINVLEWLNKKPEYRGKVAVVGSWDVYPSIFNVERSGLFMNAGWVPLEGDSPTPTLKLLNQIIAQAPRMWEDCRDDAVTFPVALEQLRRDTPRVLYIGLGDTDEHAHGGRYDSYLRAAHSTDANLAALWAEIQSHPQYKDCTTLIVTTDHGRGGPPKDWRSHGEKIVGADAIWIAVIGPDTPPLGERTNADTVTQSQVAATVAALLGEDFCADITKAAKPIADAIRPAETPAALRLSIPDDAPLERIAFGSCASQERPQPIWEAVLTAHPEVFMFLGDNIYADTEDMDVMRAKYAKLAAMPGFQALRRSVPVLATWDDHDLGVNDGGVEYPKKVESQRMFLDFFGDPADSPRRTREGVYDAHVFGPEGKRVQIILLDTRYFRSDLARVKRSDGGPYGPSLDPAKTMLGDDQWEWLKAQLTVPAELRLIASSIQVVAEDHGWEKWMNFPRERERLFSLIRDTGAEGVIFLSGDRHLAELSMMDGGVGYPIYDLTSSGLNQASKSWRPQEANQHRVATMNWGDNFGLVTIDWNQPDPLIRLQIRDVDGDVTIQQKVRLSTLKKKKSTRARPVRRRRAGAA